MSPRLWRRSDGVLMMPRLDAHHLVMAGVVGIGLYALWKLSQTSSSSPQTPNQLSPRPTPLTVPSGPLPDVPSPVMLPDNVSFVSGSPLNLTPAAWYHGRLETRNQPFPFSTNASREGLSAGLAGMGFGRIQVFMNPQEAAQDIFQPFALSGAAKGTRWFRARWPLSIERPLPKPARPSAMVFIWRAAPPAG